MTYLMTTVKFRRSLSVPARTLCHPPAPLRCVESVHKVAIARGLRAPREG